MTTRFNSFDQSRLGAFAESKAHARNPQLKESITPIIFILPTVRQVPEKQWEYQGGWNESESLVGPNRYDNNPELWHEDLKEALAVLLLVEGADWDSSPFFKPNFVVWLWQTVHAGLSHVDQTHETALIGIDPVFPRSYTRVSSVHIGDAGLLRARGEPYPEFVESVKQFRLNAEHLLLRKTVNNIITDTQKPPGGMEVPIHFPEIGESHVPGETYYWVKQPSLGELFLASMANRPLDCRKKHPISSDRNRQVFVRVLSERELKRFTDPIISDLYRRPGEVSPKDELIATIEQYRSGKDVEDIDPCRGPEDPPGDPRVRVDWAQGGGHWLVEMKKTLYLP